MDASEFHSPRANLYVSSEGFSVEVLGRVGMRYVEGEKAMLIDSEVLATPATVGMWSESIKAWDAPNDGDLVTVEDRARIVENIRRAFEWRGAQLEVY